MHLHVIAHPSHSPGGRPILLYLESYFPRSKLLAMCRECSTSVRMLIGSTCIRVPSKDQQLDLAGCHGRYNALSRHVAGTERVRCCDMLRPRLATQACCTRREYVVGVTRVHLQPAAHLNLRPLLQQHSNWSSMTVKRQQSSERVVVLGAAATAAASATSLYPALWVYIAVIAASAVVATAILQSVKPAFGGSSSKVSSAQLLDLIKSRRSIYPKDYTGDNSSITKQQLELMLEAARWAPTHKLTEPWHFVVLAGSSKAAFENLTIKCCEELLPSEKAEQVVAKLRRKQSKDWPKVHCYIAICMKRHEEVPEWEEIAATACAVQNISLVAHSLGVSGYWSSWQAVARDSAAMHEMLGIDSSRGDRCLGVWVMGQGDPERVKGYRTKRQDLAQKVVWKE